MLIGRMLHKNKDRGPRTHVKAKEYQDARKSPETEEGV